jgi:hypothetical protein
MTPIKKKTSTRVPQITERGTYDTQPSQLAPINDSGRITHTSRNRTISALMSGHYLLRKGPVLGRVSVGTDGSLLAFVE